MARWTVKATGPNNGRGAYGLIFRDGVNVGEVGPIQTWGAGDTDRKAALRAARERMRDMKQLEDYRSGVVDSQGRKIKKTNPAWIPATAVRLVKRGRKTLLQIKTRRRAR